MTTAYLAADGFEPQLLQELAHAGVRIRTRHGRLLVTDAPAIASAWAANTWFDVEELDVTSIGDTAKALRARQRSWAAYAPEHRGRIGLVTEKLPHVSARHLALGEAALGAPLGSWTLLTPTRLVCAARCSSPFPNGEPNLIEDREEPPSRAYLKLWEACLRLGRWPEPGQRCLDLGASPGGWTWLLVRSGAHVVAVDKAPLDPYVAEMPGVEEWDVSAFALDPAEVGRVDWLCSDVVAYPDRLYTLVTRWIDDGDVGTIVCSVKFQGPTDHDAVRRFAAIDGGSVAHQHHNKHEVTFVWTRDAADEAAAATDAAAADPPIT